MTSHLASGRHHPAGGHAGILIPPSVMILSNAGGGRPNRWWKLYDSGDVSGFFLGLSGYLVYLIGWR